MRLMHKKGKDTQASLNSCFLSVCNNLAISARKKSCDSMASVLAELFCWLQVKRGQSAVGKEAAIPIIIG